MLGSRSSGGPRDLVENAKWSRRLLSLNHLKSIAEFLGKGSFLAQLTSYFSLRKFGKLWVFDSAVLKLLEIDNPFQGKDDPEPGSGFLLQPPSTGVGESRLYELVWATAVCMVVGEWQKRLTIWFIIIQIDESGRGTNMADASDGGC
jgi:hypothetical protein